MQPETNEGSAYLQALRQAGNGSSATPEGAESASNPDLGTSSLGAAPQNGVERRRSPRYKCEGTAEMREDGCDAPTWASFKDVSMHGCYVEASATYPVGTNLTLKLAANGFQVHAKGTVRVNYPYQGMGIAFTDVSQDDRARLRSLLQSITRPSVIMAAVVVSRESPAGWRASVPLIFDSTVAVQALVQFFEGRQTLSRDEFLRILCNSQAESGLTTQ